MFSIKNKVFTYFALKNLSGEKIIDYIEQLKDYKPADNADYNCEEKAKVSGVIISENEYKDYFAFIDTLVSCIRNSGGSALLSLPQNIGLLPLKLTSAYDNAINAFDKLSTSEECSSYLEKFMLTYESKLMEIYVNTYSTLAKKYSIAIHAGSIPVTDKGKIYNRSFIFSNKGEIILAQDKLNLCAKEKLWGYSAGDSINTALTGAGTVAIMSDTDCMYYENIKIAREMGAKLILYSHNAKDNSLLTLLHEALIWRCDEQAVFFLQSSYSNSFDAFTRVICPTSISKNYDSIYMISSELGVHNCSIKYSRLKVAFDGYCTDKNQAFFEKTLPSLY